jgi:hypothetical protein
MRLYCDFTARSANKLLIGLVAVEFFIVFAYVFGMLSGHRTEFFNLDGEANFSAWFSSAQLFLIGQVFLLKGYLQRLASFPSPWFFLIIGIGFIFLSADETAQIHEKITGILKHIQFIPRFKGGNGIWILVYMVIGLVGCFATFRDILAMFSRYRHASKIMMAGVGVAFLGGVVFEVISYQFLRTGSTPVLGMFEIACEEFFEMFGESVTLYGAIMMLIAETVES